MIKHILKFKLLWLVLAGVIASAAFLKNAKAQMEDDAQLPKPILLTEPKESLEERMARKITLDVRDMNIVDVIKFLAQKGEFNVVISPTVDGRTTVFLHDVGIKDALDIVVISNRMAYHLDRNIVQVMSSAEYEAMYGKQFSDKTMVEIIRLQYAKPSYVLAALDNMKSNIGKIIIDEDTGSVVLVDTPQAIALMKKAITQIERPLDTIVYNMKYARADVVAEKLRARIDAKAVGSIAADERSNQVMVRVFPGRHDEVQKIIESLDEPTKEVLIEARILEVILKPNYDVGVDWTSEIATSSNGGKNIKFKNINLNDAGMSSSDNLSTTYGKIGIGNISASDFALALRALHSVSDTKILSSPQILVTNNEEAKIHIGDTVPYIIGTTVGTANPVTSEDVRFIDVGLKLNVLPIINDDGMVTMRLRPEISSVVATIQGEKSKIPQVNKTEVETSVMVQDGQTIIMAGLRKEDKVHTKKGLPVLMNLPYLGNMFSRTSDSLTSTEIVILITPRIVKGKDDYTKVLGTIKPAKSYNEGAQSTGALKQ